MHSGDYETILNDYQKILSDYEIILKKDYKAGDLYFTTSNESPSARLGGTWEKLTADAYLKIVTSNAGELDGTSPQHQIPMESMPSHSHTIRNFSDKGSIKLDGTYNSCWRSDFSPTIQTELSGGGQSYYPYYYGVYVWKRVS